MLSATADPESLSSCENEKVIGQQTKASRTGVNTADDPTSDAIEDQRQITGFRWFIFVISTLTAIFIYALDNTIVANIVPVIVGDLDGIDKLAWLSVGFMIGGMASILPLSKIYAIWDAKWVYICSTILFLASSALCGAAPTMNAEIVGRVFAGAGGNGMYYGLLALLSMHTTAQERPKYLSYTGLCWVLGPAIGGAFVLADWRWAFYMNLLFGAVLLPMYYFVIPSNNPTPDKTQLQKLGSLDWVGILLSIGAMVTIVVAINLGGVEFAWGSGSIIALFVVTGLLWILFGIQQSFCFLTSKENRLFPVHLLRHRMVVQLFIACASVAAAAYVSVYYIPLYFQFTRGDSPIYAAVRLLPFICPLITAIPLSGHLMSRWGWYKPWYIAGSILTLITGSLMAHYVTRTTAVGAIYAIIFFLGAGTGFYTQASFAVVQAVVPGTEAANGLALMLIAQLSGMAFGLSVSGSVFVNTAMMNVAKIVTTASSEELAQLIAGSSNRLINTLSHEMQVEVLDAIVSSWQKTFICVYVGAAASLVMAVFFKNGRANVAPPP